MTVVPNTLLWDGKLYAFAPRFMRLNVSEVLGHEYLLVEEGSDLVVPPEYRQINRQLRRYAVPRLEASSPRRDACRGCVNER